jgi:hypothetical protein
MPGSGVAGVVVSPEPLCDESMKEGKRQPTGKKSESGWSFMIFMVCCYALGSPSHAYWKKESLKVDGNRAKCCG